MDGELGLLLECQSGVVSRAQLLERGLADHDIRRLLRNRELALLHPGVYLDHTGPPTWRQRAWGAVLVAWPAALSHGSALRAADGPGHRGHVEDGPIHVAVGRKRTPVARPGVIVHRISHFHTRVLWNLSPPRLRVEEAIIDCASTAPTQLRTIGLLADSVQARRTTPGRLLTALDDRERIAQRDLMVGVLADIANGTCSTLEHGYLIRVERPHRLPTPVRQLHVVGRGVIRDADYEAYGLTLELDGRLFHDNPWARDADLERDLDARVIDRRVTVRLGWGQVFDRSCQTAAKIGQLLRRGGWPGHPTPCPDCPPNLVPSITAAS